MPDNTIPSVTLTGADAMRADGWSVAVHNDYRLNGKPHTFWLFIHPDGRWAKGEGRTDAEAIALAQRSAPIPTEDHEQGVRGSEERAGGEGA